MLLRQVPATFARPRQSEWPTDGAAILVLQQSRLRQTQTGGLVDGVIVKETVRVELAIAIEVIDVDRDTWSRRAAW